MLACTLIGLVLVGPAVSSTSRTGTHAVVVPVKITVVMREFRFTFSKPKVKVGTTVVFNVVNKGQVEHDLAFPTLGKSTKLLQPGQKTTLKMIFKKKGRFAYICSVPRHAQQGMAGSFQITR
jgi:uncharacterized cupredoxin-like copper-binding protein